MLPASREIFSSLSSGRGRFLHILGTGWHPRTHSTSSAPFAPGNEALKLTRGIEDESVPSAPAGPWITKPARLHPTTVSGSSPHQFKIFELLKKIIFICFYLPLHRKSVTYSVWSSVTVLYTSERNHCSHTCHILSDQHFGGVGNVLDLCDAQMVSLQHFSRFPPLPYECVFAACKYFFLHLWWC